MVTKINVQFRKLLIKDLENNDIELKKAYFSILHTLAKKNINRYDLEVLYTIDEKFVSEMSFTCLQKFCDVHFSIQFKSLIKKEKKKINKLLKKLLLEKAELEYLLSFYSNRNAFFNNFALLQKYFEKYEFSNEEKSYILNYYLSCDVDYFNNCRNEETKQEIIDFALGDYKEVLKKYFSHMQNYSVDDLKTLFKSIDEEYNSEKLKALLKVLKLNMTDQQIDIVSLYAAYRHNDFDYSTITKVNVDDVCPYFSKTAKERSFEIAKQRYLSQSEIDLLDETEYLIANRIETYTYYRLASKYYEIKNCLIKLINEPDEEDLNLNSEVIALLKNLKILEFYVSYYKSPSIQLVLTKNSN